MPDLLARPLLRPSEVSAGTRAAWLAAALATGWSLAASLALLGVLPLVVWLSEGAETPLPGPLRIGGQIWLVAHHVGLDLAAGRLTLAPLGLTLPVLLLLYRAGRWASHVAAVRDAGGLLVVVGTAAGGYGLGGILIATFASTSGAQAVPVEAGVVCAAIAAAGIGAGALHESGLAEPLWLRVPACLRAGVVGGVGATATLLAGGAALVVVALSIHSDRVAELTGRIDAGLLGGLMVTLLGASLVPNATIWGASFALGPGFTVGAGTLVSPGEVHLGAVPALPLLAALPTEDPGAAGRLSLVIPVTAGAVAGWLVHRRAPAARGYQAPLYGLGAGVFCGLAMGVATMLSAGSAGAGRLSVVGPTASQVAGSTAIEVGLAAAMAAALLYWVAGGMPMPWLATRRSVTVPGEPRASEPDSHPAERGGSAPTGSGDGLEQAGTDEPTWRIRVKDRRRRRPPR